MKNTQGVKFEACNFTKSNTLLTSCINGTKPRKASHIMKGLYIFLFY